MNDKKARNQAAIQENKRQKDRKITIFIVLIFNTILLLLIGRQSIATYHTQKVMQEMEIKKAGGEENYKYTQKIYESENYKKEQEFILQQQHKIYLQNTETTNRQ